MSKLYVNEVHSKTGSTKALEIDSDGRVIHSQPIGFNCMQSSTQTGKDHNPAAKVGGWTISGRNGCWNSGMIDLSSGVITIPKTGHYYFGANFRLDGFGGNYINIDLAGWNGTIQAGTGYRLLRHLESATATDYTAAQVSGVVYAEKDDQYVWSLLANGDDSIALDSDCQITCWFVG